jgi:hypothetical protein
MLAPRHLHTTHTAQNSNWLLACRKPKHTPCKYKIYLTWQCEYSLGENDFTSFPIHRGVEATTITKNSGMFHTQASFFSLLLGLQL